eukprot:m.8277 g.8277  ORF g.8277 m.8277 type:complete len:363 (-) comp3182_c0_seq1:291-1379(-)
MMAAVDSSTASANASPSGPQYRRRKQGWMELRSVRQTLFSKRYRFDKRWFELEGGKLNYSETQGSSLLGVIALRSKATAIELEGEEKRVLAVTVDNRTYRCRCESHDNAVEWLRALRAARDRPKSLLSRRSLMEVCVKRRGDSGELGFAIAGGADSGHQTKTSIFVCSVKEDGPADFFGGLEKGDMLLEVDGQSLENVPHAQAGALLTKAGSEVMLKIARRQNSKGSLALPTTVREETTKPEAESFESDAAAPTESKSSSVSSQPAAATTAEETSTDIPIEAPGEAPTNTDPAATEAATPADPVAAPAKPAEPAEDTPSQEERERQRAELRRRLSASRIKRKESQHLEVLQVLSVIDDLPED